MRRSTGLTGAGAVLLAMMMLAILIGLGSRAIDARDRSGGDSTNDLAHAAGPIVIPTETPDGPAPIVVAEPTPTPGALYQSPGGVTASAVHVWRPVTGELLVDRSADERMQVGSIVKVATAIVALQHADLDDQVLIDPTDLVDPAVYSNMGLVAGDTLTVEQLLMGLLIPSGGDAAEALARHAGSVISGSDDPDEARAAFVAAMNDWATELGLQNTRFANASGDDDAASYSSARDVSIMAAELLESRVLTDMVGMPGYEFTSAGGNAYTGLNTNAMLGESGVIGVKTGSTGNAGGCVVLARLDDDGDATIITILGSDLAYNELNQIVADARWDDARLLFSTIDT
ncbi:MAG: D-alanyl-D-alanine carboxypeptidase [Thermomicrobiales bacterium]|nr:D-alanyl-D-alanine carboxypeptidase [Thermomicrobiales bacterium]